MINSNNIYTPENVNYTAENYATNTDFFFPFLHKFKSSSVGCNYFASVLIYIEMYKNIFKFKTSTECVLLYIHVVYYLLLS